MVKFDDFITFSELYLKPRFTEINHIPCKDGQKKHQQRTHHNATKIAIINDKDYLTE